MQLKEKFERDGFLFIENAYNLEAVAEFEATILRMADKLCAEVGAAAPTEPYAKLRYLCQNHKPEFYKLCSSVGSTLSASQMFASSKIEPTLRVLVGQDSLDYFLVPLFLFFNDKGSERLQYEYHQESVAFPTVHDAIHAWAPLFRDLTKQDGPMVMLRGSHKRDYPYRAVTAPHSVTQLLIDPKLLETYEPVHCEMKRGSVVLFHHQLVHASGTNLSGLPRISCTARLLNLKAEEVFEPYVRYYFAEADSRKKVASGGK